jgi:hypothetical protein
METLSLTDTIGRDYEEDITILSIRAILDSNLKQMPIARMHQF